MNNKPLRNSLQKKLIVNQKQRCLLTLTEEVCLTRVPHRPVEGAGQPIPQAQAEEVGGALRPPEARVEEPPSVLAGAAADN